MFPKNSKIGLVLPTTAYYRWKGYVTHDHKTNRKRHGPAADAPKTKIVS